MKRARLQFISVICAIIVFWGFTLPSPALDREPGQELEGEWRNVYLKMVIHHKNGAIQTMEADSTNWEQRLGIHPIRTHFSGDGSYYSEYFNLKDSLVRRPTGEWKINDDSVTMTQLTPDKGVYRFLLTIENGRATFSGNIDFDGDGMEDDVYYGIQMKYH